MASKIRSHHVYVAITPYEMEGQRYDEVDVMTAYDDRAKHFYVNLHPGWKTDYGHGCFLYGGDDPLTASKWVKVKDSPKNSQKFINEAGGALEMAKDAIAWLFDKRDWQRLYVAVRNIALNGYTEKYRQQMEQLKSLTPDPSPKGEGSDNNNSINKTSEDNTMRLNMDANNNESANVQNNAQVNNPIEDAVAVEVTTEADVQEVNDIVPKVTKQTHPQPLPVSEGSSQKQAVTMPLGKHGSIVIAGIAGTKKEEPSAISHQPSVKVQDSVPQDPTPNTPTPKNYRVVLVPAKDGGEWPKLYGFKTEKDAEKMVGKMAKSIRNTWDRDEKNEKRFYIKGGKKYCEVFQRLCDALNTGDKAAIDAACKDSVAVYEGAVADGKAEREERKAQREAEKNAAKPETKPATEKSYTLDEVAAMLGKLLPNGAASTEDIKKLLQAA